jgi:hypothetical protein
MLMLVLALAISLSSSACRADNSIISIAFCNVQIMTFLFLGIGDIANRIMHFQQRRSFAIKGAYSIAPVEQRRTSQIAGLEHQSSIGVTRCNVILLQSIVGLIIQ